MMLTTKGRYAVMAMVDIAHYSCNGEAVALHEISERQDITVSYLEQLFGKLKKANLVTSIKGPGGGYKIAKNTNDISMMEIINAVEESIKMTRCEEKEKGCLVKQNKFCFTHALWNGLENHISNYLTSISLADVCNKIKKGN